MNRTIRYKLLLLLLFLLSIKGFSQYYEDYQLRLEPVWSRVADALGEPGSVESAEFSKDGKYIVSGTKFDNSVIMWRTSDGAELWRQYVAEEVERVGFSADGKYVASCSEDFLVTLFDAQTGEKLKEIKHNNGIDGLTWSNKGLLLVSGEEQVKKKDDNPEAFIRVFDMPSGNEIKAIDFQGTVNEVFFSSDDRLLLAAGHGSVRIYQTDDWSLIRTFEGKDYRKFISGVLSPDSRYVFASDNRGFMYLWEIESGKLLKTLNHTGKKVETVAWHPSGKHVAFAGHDSYIRIYRVEDIIKYDNDRVPIVHRVWASDNAEYIDFNSDGSFLVSGLRMV